VKNRSVQFLFVVVFWIAAWQYTVLWLDLSTVLPPPTDVAVAMGEQGREVLLLAVRPVAWALGAWLLGIIATILAGTLSLRSSIAGAILSVPLAIGRTLPSVIAVPLFAVVAGHDRWSTFSCAAFLATSYSAPAFKESLAETHKLRRVAAECLGLTPRQEFALVSLPGVGQSLQGISIQSFGIALVVTIAGEMILGLQGSAGERIAEWSWLLRMREVYALVVWLVVGTLVTERLAGLIPRVLRIPGRLLFDRLCRVIARTT
jgi:ABC-type nitrate/sulfonate/bicarbonate transport system permease component